MFLNVILSYNPTPNPSHCIYYHEIRKRLQRIFSVNGTRATFIFFILVLFFPFLFLARKNKGNTKISRERERDLKPKTHTPHTETKQEREREKSHHLRPAYTYACFTSHFLSDLSLPFTHTHTVIFFLLTSLSDLKNLIPY